MYKQLPPGSHCLELELGFSFVSPLESNFFALMTWAWPIRRRKGRPNAVLAALASWPFLFTPPLAAMVAAAQLKVLRPSPPVYRDLHPLRLLVLCHSSLPLYAILADHDQIYVLQSWRWWLSTLRLLQCDKECHSCCLHRVRERHCCCFHCASHFAWVFFLSAPIFEVAA